SVSSKSSGVSPPSSASLSSVHGIIPLSLSSPHVDLDIPTGVMPKASGTSWFAQPTVAIRSGFDSMTVSPRACSTVTGNCAASAGLLDSELEPLAGSDAAEPLASAESASSLVEHADKDSAAMTDAAVSRTTVDLCTV